MAFQLIPLLLICTLQFLPVTSHGSGAPSNRCDTMTPGHWVSPQETISPYQVIIDKTAITPGDRVNITLRTIKGQTGFKGFFVMVKDGDEDVPEGHKPDNSQAYGEFDLASSDQAQPVHCFNKRNSAMTHVKNDVKDSIQLFWIAPTLLNNKRSQYMDKELRVVATFVKDFWTVWTEVEPVGEVRLLLTDTHQLSPKFQQPHVDPTEQQVQQSEPEEKASVMENLPLDESNSWTHFKRAWNYMVGFFGSSQTS